MYPNQCCHLWVYFSPPFPPDTFQISVKNTDRVVKLIKISCEVTVAGAILTSSPTKYWLFYKLWVLAPHIQLLQTFKGPFNFIIYVYILTRLSADEKFQYRSVHSASYSTWRGEWTALPHSLRGDGTVVPDLEKSLYAKLTTLDARPSRGPRHRGR